MWKVSAQSGKFSSKWKVLRKLSTWSGKFQLKRKVSFKVESFILSGKFFLMWKVFGPSGKFSSMRKVFANWKVLPEMESFCFKLTIKHEVESFLWSGQFFFYKWKVLCHFWRFAWFCNFSSNWFMDKWWISPGCFPSTLLNLVHHFQCELSSKALMYFVEGENWINKNI